MFLSSKRAVIAACAAVVFVVTLLATYHTAVGFKSTFQIPTSFPSSTSTGNQTTGNDSTATEFTGIFAGWTTEQLVPRFAYVQYATDLDYLCNTVSES